DAPHETLLDIRQGTLRNECLGAVSPQQAVDHRINDERTDLETRLPRQRRNAQNVEARGARQGTDEFAVGELLAAPHAYFDNRSQESRKRGRGAARKTSKEAPQGPDFGLC